MALLFEPHRFRTTVEHYVRGRLSYPEELIAWAASRAGLDRRHRVLDLGCGPGFLAAAFAPFVQEVIGLDPEPAMLAAAAAWTREKGVAVTLRQGSSYDLGAHLGLFQLVTMGRSFHWMDRAATLEALAGIVAPTGAVALFKDSHLDVPENRWRERFRAVLEPFNEKDPARAAVRRRDPSWLSHEAYLLGSPFRRLERISVIRRLETPVDRLIDRALSMSSTSPEKLGAGLEAFVDRVRAVLNEEASVDGTITEVVESEALLGFSRGDLVERF